MWQNKNYHKGAEHYGKKSEYTREEKRAAVKPVTESGRTMLSVANEYGIHENTPGKWKRQYTYDLHTVSIVIPVLFRVRSFAASSGFAPHQSLPLMREVAKIFDF